MLSMIRTGITFILGTPPQYMPFVVSRAFMAGAAKQAGDANSSRAPGLTSGLQGCVNVNRGALFVDATVTVHQFFLIYIDIKGQYQLW